MTIEEYYDDIPYGARVVFDWDNTLKIINKDTKSIECRVKPSFLQSLVKEKGCLLYIISAIRPSRMNMDTLLMEVDRLGIREFFCPFWQAQHHPRSESNSIENKSLGFQRSFVEMIHGNVNIYVRWGNIIICDYDKAEVFLEVINAEKIQEMAIKKILGLAPTKMREDVVDAVEDNNEINIAVSTKEAETNARPVVFFDDEKVNITNFSKIVKDSVCILVK